MPLWPYTLKLASCPNPDHDETIAPAAKVTVPISNLREAKLAAESYRDQNGLGGGNWIEGQILRDGKVVALISYNGRIWTTEADWKQRREFTLDEMP